MKVRKRKESKIDKIYRRKARMNHLQDVFDFFERTVYLIELSIYKVFSILTIPMFILGLSGAYYTYKMVTDVVKNNINFWHSDFLGMAYKFLGIYMGYILLKNWLETSMERK